MPIAGDCLNEHSEKERYVDGLPARRARGGFTQNGSNIKRPVEQDDTPAENQWQIQSSESRRELIQRIKRKSRHASELPTNVQPSPDAHTAEQSSAHEAKLPQDTKNNQAELSSPSSIQRPRSALHSGDFHDESFAGVRSKDDEEQIPATPQAPSRSWFSTSPTTPWFEPRHRPIRTVTDFSPNERYPLTPKPEVAPVQTRLRALSVQSSNFVFRPPTSPLAMQSNSSDLDSLHELNRHRSRSPDKASRRRTHSPRSLRSLNDLPNVPQMPVGAQARAPPTLRKENTFPYQAHQPRRSLSSFVNLATFPHTQNPSARARRPSITSDTSPMQHASLVGRYEESILRGRMSTNASKPVDFVAQIGVLGKGTCKPSLRCPRHVTVAFPAFFYNYGHYRDHTSGSTEGPSPYVGQIDFANVGQKESDARRGNEIQQIVKDGHDHRASRQKGQGTRSTRKPPGGGYRIPQQGQLQVILKNPHKTAVKLFLVPYDLSGMEPGQKTFIRQRSFSAGPIIDMPLASRKNFGSDRPEAAICYSDDPNDRPILRYLIHLHICCTSKGHFYLYKSIRVVFANRVPDGKEKLRHEIQLPDPRFTDYKPEREMKQILAAQASNSPLLGPQLSPRPQLETAMETVDCTSYSPLPKNDYDMSHYSQSYADAPREPPRLMSPFSVGRDQWQPDPMDIDSPNPSSAHSPQQTTEIDFMQTGLKSPPYLFERLDREFYSSSSNGSRPQTPKPGEGLLAQQIRQHRSPSAS